MPVAKTSKFVLLQGREKACVMRIVVSGYYGCGNTGDEAVLAGIKTSFARTNQKVTLTALSQNPAETTALQGLPSVNRMSLAEVRQTLREADLLISGGGSLLQDTTSLQSLLYYLWVMRMGFSAGIPVMMYAQGIGPLRRAMSRRLVRTVANRTSAITVRDEPSADLLKKIGVTYPTIEVTADPAFALTPADARIAEAILRAEGVPTHKPLIGLSLRPWGGTGESPLSNYAKLIDLLALKTGTQIVLISMHQPSDHTFAKSVVEQTAHPESCSLLTGNYTPQELLAVVGKMSTVVAMRLHALIFAARMTVPAFALSYDPKVESLMALLGLEDCVESWRSFDPEETAERIVEVFREKEVHSSSLAARLPLLEASALRNAERALSLGERRLDTLKTLISR